MKKCDFDERQLYIRGDIFKHMTIAFVVLLLCNAFLMDNGFIWADAFHSNLIIMLIAGAIGSNEMIFKEVYVSKTGFQNIAAFLIGMISGVCLIFSIIRIVQGVKIVEGNQLTDTGGNIVMMLLLFSIFVGYIIKSALGRSKRQKD